MQSVYNHPSEILVATLKRLYDLGMTTTSGGNLSICDDEGNIWITPSGIDKGSLKPSDIVRVTPSGEIIGIHKPSCELPFHRAVYRKRPDVKAVLHAHSPAIVTFSLIQRMPDEKLFPGDADVCGKVAFAEYEIPGSEILGEKISEQFANGADSVIMENHGAVVCGTSITHAFARFETLDYIARIQFNAIGMGKITPFNISACGKPSDNVTEFTPSAPLPRECELRNTLVNFAQRAYRQKLIFCGGAMLSARLGIDDFLVTPHCFDPYFLECEDISRICNGERQAGTSPALSFQFFRALYNQCDWANAAFFARTPYMMAFAATANVLDSRTIPESYIMLRDIPMVSQEDFCKNPTTAISLLAPERPVVIVESCGVIATGKTILEAFDRLEVGEFTANCVLMANRLGQLTPINQKQVDDIIEAFHLPH